MSDVSSSGELKGRALYDALRRIAPPELNDADWCRAAEVNKGFLTNLKTGSGSVRSDNLRKLLGAIGKSEADLYGNEPAPARSPTRQWAGSNPQPDLPVPHSVDAGDTVQIARLDLSLPMGPGALVDDYVEEEPLTFDAGYIRSFTRTPPHRLRLAAGAGDSMFPTLVPNDLVWIDTTQNELRHADRIYAASINGGAAIKRLRPLAGGSRVLVISDNKMVEPYEVDAADVVIWGRVIRFARDL